MITKEERRKSFIKKSIAKHGTVYGYKYVDYVNNTTKVKIECPLHGIFEMRPSNLLSGQNCPKCPKKKGGPKTLTQEEFINKVKKVHGDRYNLDKTIYIRNVEKVIVTCKKHGDFSVLPSNFLSGTNCPKCNTGNKLSQEQFLLKAKAVHGNTYNYDKTIYKLNDAKVIITCPRHGDFEQTPNAHINGSQGCPACGKLKASSKRKHKLPDILKRFKKIHGDKYDYSKVVLGNTLKDKVVIICKVHGEFLQTPHKHLLNRNCPKCSGKYQATKEEWFAKAKKVHGTLYDYSKVVYPPPVTAKGTVVVTCRKHGDFTVSSRDHVGKAGSGCPVCSSSKGELKIRDFLIANKIEYKREYSFPNSRYRYDFYLPKLNILIEYDGIQHFRAIDYFGGEKRYKVVKANDKNKNELALLYSIPLIRIPYLNYNTLESYLVWKLSKIYRYRVNNKFYKNFLELCKGEQLPESTNSKDVKKYLFYKKEDWPL